MPRESGHDVIVVGGGPAGLVAAGEAALAGADTVLLEKMARPGRKLAITGKGRCNLTNVAELPDFIEHFGKSGRFLHQAFSRYFTDDLIAFFEETGVAMSVERGGRVFPAQARAPQLVEALVNWCRACGAEIKTKIPVHELIVSNGKAGGVVSGGDPYRSDSVVLATGGMTYPATGSTGDGYRLAASVGHKLVPAKPALVPLETVGSAAKRMAGLSLRNVSVKLLVNGRAKRKEFGEMAFTDCSVTGPVILTMSGDAVVALAAGKEVVLAIDLKPALDEKKLDARLVRDFESRGKEPLGICLRGLLPREMVPICIEGTGIPADRKAGTITAVERRRLLAWLKEFRLEVSGHRPVEEAIISAGGVDTREVDPKTMESRVVPGLFIAGELLDVQADTGGYNLQAAFSTGWLAGRAAATFRSAVA